MNSALFDTALKADIIFCVDARDEMALLADKIKSVICDFPQNLAEQAEGAGGIQSVRTKVITFRDYRYSEHPLVESEFFNVLDKEQEKEFRSYVNGIVFKDGANGTANIYEAIWAALRSEWITCKRRARHIIMLFTNAKPIALQARAEQSSYPENAPHDIVSLLNIYEGNAEEEAPFYSRKSGRMLIFSDGLGDDESLIASTHGTFISSIHSVGQHDFQQQLYDCIKCLLPAL